LPTSKAATVEQSAWRSSGNAKEQRMHATEMMLSLLGSVALLLWGVRMVRTGMMRAFGAGLRHCVATSTRSWARAFLAGLGVTGLLQSSTATAILLASFTARGLIALHMALVMMLGANIGTTLTAQIFAFDVSWLWTLSMALGVVIFTSSEEASARAVARICIGFGLMLLSLMHLHAAAAPLQNAQSARTLLGGLAGEPLVGFVVGAALTWLLHSSLTMVLLVMSLATTSIIAAPLAFALVLGANVGGAVAPFTALLGSPPTARRVALGNLLMRAAIALPFLFLLDPSVDALKLTTASAGHLVLNFHTGFNVIASLLLLPFCRPVARLMAAVLPEKIENADAAKPRHLDPDAVDTPSEALGCAMRETLHMGDRVADMLAQALVVIEKSDARLMREVEKADDAVDGLHEAIKLYLVKASKSEMSEEESRRYVEILTFTTNLEHVGDIIDKNLMELAAKKIRNKYAFSAEGLDEIRLFHHRVMDNMRLALNVFATRDVTIARRLLSEKATTRAAEMAAVDSHFARLREGRPESIETSAIHLDVIRDLKRINAHFASAAYPILEAAGELRPSRLHEAGSPALLTGPVTTS
jgi:phosphate:Na+ symporter